DCTKQLFFSFPHLFGPVLIPAKTLLGVCAPPCHRTNCYRQLPHACNRDIGALLLASARQIAPARASGWGQRTVRYRRSSSGRHLLSGAGNRRARLKERIKVSAQDAHEFAGWFTCAQPGSADLAL